MGKKMIFNEKKISLKNGQECIIRSPKREDSENMIAFLKCCADETDYLLRYSEEFNETIEQEEKFLQSINDSSFNLIIVALINGEIAGNCMLNIHSKKKVRHRGSIAIAVKKKFWNLGLGTLLIQELINTAKANGCLQLELEFIEGNHRGKALYQKMGFTIIGERKRSIILKDGTCLSEFIMVKFLDDE